MDTHTRLIQAASDLIAEGGESAATLRAVGHRAGVSHNAPYKHFKNRRELLAAVAAAELTRMKDEFDAVSGKTPGARARQRALAVVRMAAERPELYELTYGSAIQGAESPELNAAAVASYGTLIAGIAAAQQAGELPGSDPERLVALIRATAHGAAFLARNRHLASDGKGRASAEEVVDDLFRYLTALSKPASEA